MKMDMHFARSIGTCFRKALLIPISMIPVSAACSSGAPAAPASRETDFGSSVAHASRSGRVGDPDAIVSATLTSKATGGELANLRWSTSKQQFQTVIHTDQGGVVQGLGSAKDLVAPTAPLEKLTETVHAMYEAGRKAPGNAAGSIKLQDENLGPTCTPYSDCAPYSYSSTSTDGYGFTVNCTTTGTCCVVVFADCSSGTSTGDESTTCDKPSPFRD